MGRLERKRISSTIISSLLLAQSVPVFAQTVMPVMVHTHVWTPPTVPVLSQNSGSLQTTSSGTHTGTHHHWLYTNGTSSNNNGWGQSLITPTLGTTRGPVQSNVQNATPASSHTSSLHNANFINSAGTTHNPQVLTGTVASGTHTAPSINLNLSSTIATTTAGRLLGNGTVTITVGGSSLVVNSSTPLTSAERVAVQQVLQTGTQTLVIDAQGSASGGSMTISPFLSSHLGSLVIPQGVSVTDLSKSGTLNIKGNVTDDGNLYVVTTNPNVGTVIINANNLTVQSQGLLTDLLPAGSVFTSLVPSNLNLTLNVTGNITNAGTINSAGGLNLNAGGSITNAPTAPNLPTPTIQATNTVNLVTGSGNITNAGLISSATGNINISSSVPSNDINITGTGGTFQALNGDINIRDASYTGAGNVGLAGGNYLSEDFNIYSGTGTVNVNVGQLTGALSTYAQNAHIFADTSELLLSNTCVTGDPIFATTGDLALSGSFNFSEDVAFIAGGNITASTAVTRIITNGNNIWMVAGADIISINGTPTTSPLSAPGTSNITSVSFTFDASYGGNIDFTNVLISPIFQTLGGGGSQAGNVTLVAYSNSSTNGNILFPNTTGRITANTTQYSGAGGNFTAIAGGIGPSLNSNAIQLGQIETAGSTTSGAVSIVTATPSVGGGGTFSISGGVITPPSFSNGTTTASASISVGAIQTLGYEGGVSGANGGNGGAITITGGGNVTTGDLLSYGGGGQGAIIGLSGIGNGGSAGTISVSSTSGDIDINGEINSSGGGGGGGIYIHAGGSGGSQAPITLSAPSGSVTVTGNIYSYAGGAGGSDPSNQGGGNGGGGSFGGAGGGGGGNGPSGSGGGGGGGAAGGGGGGGANSTSVAFGGGFDGGGTGGGGTPSGADGNNASDLTYGNGSTGSGGAGGNSGGAGGTNTATVAGGGSGASFANAGGNAGPTYTVGGTLTVFVPSETDFTHTSVVNVGNTEINTGGGGGGGTTTPSTTTSGIFTTLTSAQLSALLATLSAYFNSTTTAMTAQNQQNEQVGTKVATDNTPMPDGTTQSSTSVMATTTPGTIPAGTTAADLAASLSASQSSNLSAAGQAVLGYYQGLSTADTAVSAAEKAAQAVSSPSSLVASATATSAAASNVATRMQSSSLAVALTEDPVITTREGVASVPPGAVAIVATRPNETYVYDMQDDLHTGPVTFKVNEQVLKLSPGTGIIITRDLKADFHSLNPYEKLGYRNVRSTDLGNGMKAFICDFSVVDGLNNIAAVRDLLRSSDPVQRKLAWKMIKNATILADMTGNNYHAGQ